MTISIHLFEDICWGLFLMTLFDFTSDNDFHWIFLLTLILIKLLGEIFWLQFSMTLFENSIWLHFMITFVDDSFWCYLVIILFDYTFEDPLCLHILVTLFLVKLYDDSFEDTEKHLGIIWMLQHFSVTFFDDNLWWIFLIALFDYTLWQQ